MNLIVAHNLVGGYFSDDLDFNPENENYFSSLAIKTERVTMNLYVMTSATINEVEEGLVVTEEWVTNPAIENWDADTEEVFHNRDNRYSYVTLTKRVSFPCMRIKVPDDFKELARWCKENDYNLTSGEAYDIDEPFLLIKIERIN